MQISVYKLTTTPLEKALPKLLERILDQGFTCHITTPSEDMCRTLNTSIWTFSTLAFLPHGSVFDADLNPKDQPIWLSLDQTIQNDANVMVMLKPEIVTSNDFKRVVYCYDAYGDMAPDFETFITPLKSNGDVAIWEQTKTGWQKS